MHPSMRVKAAVVTALTAVLTIGAASTASATSDTTAPVLHSISLDAPGPYTAGDSVSYTWSATDDSGIKQTQVHFVDAAGKDHTLVGGPGASTGSVSIDAAWANGPVQVTWIFVLDNNQNDAWYFPDGHVDNQPGGTGTHTIDFSSLSFSTVDTGADVVPPTLTSISLVTPGPLTAGDQLTVQWTATDDNTGVGYLQALFLDSAGKQHALGASSPTSQASTTIGPNWANGPAHLAEVVLYDKAGNSSIYEADGSATYTPSNAGPPQHNLDFSALDFDTTDTGADTTPPQLNSISLAAPGPFGDGDSVTYNFDATDDSGIQQVAVRMVDAANKAHDFFSSAGASSVSFTIDPSWGLGQAKVESITIQDPNGNSAEYLWNGTLVNTPGGNSTHSIDFQPLSFDVVDGPPSATFQDKPAATSDSSTAHFAFSASDPYDAPATLATSCSVDGSATPCASGAATLNDVHDGVHRFRVTVTDPRGNVSKTVYQWQVDTAAPRANLAAFARRFMLASTTTVSVIGSDTGSGIASYDLRYRSTSYAGVTSRWHYPAGWQRTTRAAVSSPTLRPGKTYCFAVRAHDVAGNRSTWSAARCVTRVLDDTALSVSTGWTRRAADGYYQGTVTTATAQGAMASLAGAQSRRIAIVATTCPTCGTVGIYIGGAAVATIDLRTSVVHRRTVLVVPGVAYRSGRLVVRVLSGAGRVELDGVGLSSV